MSNCIKLIYAIYQLNVKLCLSHKHVRTRTAQKDKHMSVDFY
jgi:hypothetical protein